jgi:uncharacterized membrane protein
MLPPIRHAKLNADTLLKGRGTSSNPPLFDAKNRGWKDKRVLTPQFLNAAKSEVLVLQTIQENPGLTIKQIAEKTGFSRTKVELMLKDYRNDQLVRYKRVGRQYFWYLED